MSTSDLWLQPAPTSRARLRLFCFPYAGGSARVFRGWSSAFPPQIEICAVQLPGREMRLRERPFTTMAPLIQALAEALAPHLETPFAFFGHSLGALISFELAHALHARQGVLPAQLFVSACRAPQLPSSNKELHQLPDGELVEELGHLGGTPAEVLANAELMRLVLPLFRADLALYERYGATQREPLPCPISAFGGLADPRVQARELQAWEQQTSRSFQLRMLPGDHFFLHSAQAPLLAYMDEELQALLSHSLIGG